MRLYSAVLAQDPALKAERLCGSHVPHESTRKYLGALATHPVIAHDSKLPLHWLLPFTMQGWL